MAVSKSCVNNPSTGLSTLYLVRQGTGVPRVVTHPLHRGTCHSGCYPVSLPLSCTWGGSLLPRSPFKSSGSRGTVLTNGK